MWIPFNEMPEEARVWIYPSNRKLSPEEVTSVTEVLQSFVADWAAHGTPLEASFDIRYDRFIILAVNGEVQPASGCSIDASVKVIQDLEQQLGIDLLDKMNVTFKTGDFLAHKTLTEFKKMAKDKAVNEDTIVFNNLINTVGELEADWEVPASDSWHGRFF
ncbi:MAG: ABC transporter ATPase [Flavobacterium sp. BFFFF2]|nr:MAG: ABC transporter ATPase [Flavobacterium sp. BFFFF2]